ncbi:hypothetical protein KXD40_005938 [Peronospora effusa]|nr:hypothetical protein KXD40_005938 [Peronospora effusa]
MNLDAFKVTEDTVDKKKIEIATKLRDKKRKANASFQGKCFACGRHGHKRSQFRKRETIEIW